MDKLKLVETVKKFNGSPEEDAEQWLIRFETAVRILSTARYDAERLKEIATLRPLFIDVSAFRAWNQLEEAEKKDS